MVNFHLWKNIGYDLLDSAVYGNQISEAQPFAEYEGQTLNLKSKYDFYAF